jgi:hypothetical protein
MIRATELYGALPESVYTGLINGNKSHNHQKMFGLLKDYLDSTCENNSHSRKLVGRVY